MSYRSEIRAKVAALSLMDEKRDFESRIKEIIEDLYIKALDESKRTGQSVESITYEILEGLEEGLNTLHRDLVEQLLQAASKTITDIIHKSAQENISRKNRNIQLAIDKLHDTIEAEKAHLIEAMEAFKAYADDHTHRHFAENLHHLQERLEKLLHTVTDTIKENRK